MSTLQRSVRTEPEYPSSDGKPMAETPLHMRVMMDLIETLIVWFAGEPLVYVWGNLFLYYVKGDPKKGSSVYASSGCGGCHTLAAAHSTGTVGPNLDALKPNYRAVTAQVTNGGGPMPAYKTRLSKQQIADVSAYVVESTGGTAP